MRNVPDAILPKRGDLRPKTYAAISVVPKDPTTKEVVSPFDLEGFSMPVDPNNPPPSESRAAAALQAPAAVVAAIPETAEPVPPADPLRSAAAAGAAGVGDAEDDDVELETDAEPEAQLQQDATALS